MDGVGSGGGGGVDGEGAGGTMGMVVGSCGVSLGV